MKVLGFDSWTKGSHHFARLTDAFAQQGMSLQVLHLGSWGNDPGQPTDYSIGGLRIRDITSYGSMSLDAILAMEKPDAVILLSTETFAHRAMIRLCRERGIPTLNLYHGVTSVFYNDDGREDFRTPLSEVAKVVVKKASKMFTKTIPVYSSVLLRTRARVGEWLRFGGDLQRLATGRFKFKASLDARTTSCGVYVEADVAHAMGKYGHRREEVHVVGNPDLISFDLPERLLGLRAKHAVATAREIMYLESGFHEATSGGEPDYIAHLRQTSEALSAQGFRMLFKSKPSNFTPTLAAGLEKAGIDVISSTDFVPRLEHCAAAIVEFTSIALFPAFLGLPVFLAKYGPWKDITFGVAMHSYPRSIVLENLSAIRDQLRAEAAQLDADKVLTWIGSNVGPLPAAGMPDRVAGVVAKMIAAARGRR